MGVLVPLRRLKRPGDQVCIIGLGQADLRILAQRAGQMQPGLFPADRFLPGGRQGGVFRELRQVAPNFEAGCLDRCRLSGIELSQGQQDQTAPAPAAVKHRPGDGTGPTIPAL